MRALTVTCISCHQSFMQDDTCFCYECSQHVCPDCVRFAWLPLDTKAAFCAARAAAIGYDLLPSATSRQRLKENLLHCRVMAALGGHALSEWRETGDARWYVAGCVQCGKTIQASTRTYYSVLADACPERDNLGQVIGEVNE